MHKLFYLRGIRIHLDHDGLVATPPPSSEPEPDVNDISDQPEEISSDQTVNIDDTNDDDMMQSENYNTVNDVYQLPSLNSNVSLPTPSSVYVTSTDGTYSVINKAAGVAKKPGQRKRPVNAKTSKRH